MIDLGWLGHIAFSWEFAVAVGTIVLIDLVLAGDNAVVIAMAVKRLEGKERPLGIILGSAGAVLVRVVCTFAGAQLLNLSFVKLIDGAVIIWIGVKLLTRGPRSTTMPPYRRWKLATETPDQAPCGWCMSQGGASPAPPFRNP